MEAISDDVIQLFLKPIQQTIRQEMREILRALQRPAPPPIMLSELIEQFVSASRLDGRWREHMAGEHRARLRTLLEILGDRPAGSVCRKDMRRFRDILRNLPPCWRRIIARTGQSAQELAESHSGTRLKALTVNITMSSIASMFGWAVREELLLSNPAAGLCIRCQDTAIDKRQPLSRKDILAVFARKRYSPEKFINPAYYWCPLISLYTGMRLEEIAQLHCEDVYSEEGVAIIHVRDESADGLNDKIIKNANAMRKIPIHKKLVERGFLKYVEGQKNAGEIRLFPGLHKCGGKYGKQVGIQFSRLLAERGIRGRKSFHSLRHTFSNFFKKKNLQTDMFRQIFGHEIPHMAGSRYGDRFTAREIYDGLISKIDY